MLLNDDVKDGDYIVRYGANQEDITKYKVKITKQVLPVDDEEEAELERLMSIDESSIDKATDADSLSVLSFESDLEMDGGKKKKPLKKSRKSRKTHKSRKTKKGGKNRRKSVKKHHK
jgi:hypothetical protein